MIQQSIEKIEQIETRSNPFPGLRPFELHESHLFFGRDGQSEQLIAKLNRARFLAVVGSSGSGKSSLVRAGLLPSLLAGFMASAGSNWRMAIMRPGADPIGNLARALNEPDVFGSEDDENRAIQTDIIKATLRRSSLGLIDTTRLNGMPRTENLLVLADQFEEIFRFAQTANDQRYENEAAAFVKLLLEAARQQDVNIYVVLTMRSDYLGDCAQFPDLPEAINEGQYLIPRLTRDQRREAIEFPVAVAGAEITPRLVNRLLNDVGDNPDQLPILQHALMRAWDEWKKERETGRQSDGATGRDNDDYDPQSIDLRHYEAIGEMSEALSLHAEEAYSELSGPRHKLAEQIFKCLTEKGADNREIRRPLSLRELCAVTEADESDVIAVIETFRRAGRSFLMPPADLPLRGESLIDISHESLIRNWKRLKEWVEDEAQCAATYRRMAETAVLYNKGEAGLWRDPDLQIALEWRGRIAPNEAWAQRYHPEFETAMAFLEASKKRKDEDIVEHERAQKEKLAQAEALAEAQKQRIEEQSRAASRLRQFLAALIVVFLLALVAAVYAAAAYRQAEAKRAEADEQRTNAERQKQEAERQRQEADAAKQKALDQESIANQKKDEAAKAAQIAESEKRKAEAQARLASNRLADLKNAILMPPCGSPLNTTTNSVPLPVSELIASSVTITDEAKLRSQEYVERTNTKGNNTIASRARARIPKQYGLDLWESGSTLRVRFIGGTAAQHEIFREAAEEWASYANIKFRFVSDSNAEIRVSFEDSSGAWSYLGAQVLAVSAKGPTMNIGLNPGVSEKYSALHVLGYALGLTNEISNPNARLPWDKEAVYGQLSGVSKEHVDQIYFRVEKGIEYREFDPDSVMTHPIPPKWFKDGRIIGGKGVLSESDKQFIRKLYPPN